jgi:hypothetical protein
VTNNVCGSVTRIPSSDSGAVAEAKGSVTGVAVGKGAGPPTVTESGAASSVRPLNSTTRPVTVTNEPTVMDGAKPAESKTKMPSDVVGSVSASASSSCTKNPRRPLVPGNAPTTTPCTVTSWPTSGLLAPGPCTS